MDVRLSSEQHALRDAAARIVDRHGVGAVGQLDDAERRAKLRDAIVESGWLELRTPDDDGSALASAVEAAIVAEELGVRPEDVRVVHGDSGATSHGTGTYASRSAVLGGGAAIVTSRVLRDKIRRVASHLLEAAAEDIETGDGRVFVTGTDKSMSFAEVAHAVYSDMKALPADAREILEASESFDPVTGTTTTATHIATVEIDPETFAVKIGRYLVAEDCGRMINPLVVDGQVHGGVAQGIGAALLEELSYDRTGQLLTGSLADYTVPTAVEVPHIDVVHLETELPGNPGGFRGMGEGGTIGAPAAIANAISDALSPLGAGVSELPVTPERLFRLVSAAQGKTNTEE